MYGPYPWYNPLPNTSVPISKQTEASYLQWQKTQQFEDVGWFLVPYVVDGGYVTKNIRRNDEIDISQTEFVLDNSLQQRQSVQGIKLKNANSTYFVDIYKGDYWVDTNHPQGTVGQDYITLAEVTTDSNGNVDVITDTAGVRGGFRLKSDYGLFGYLRHIFDVTDYGAKGDGITNDRPAIQSAIDAAKDAGGGIVVFPFSENPYMIDGIPLLLYDNIEIQGNGSTLKLISGSFTTMVAFFSTISSLSGNYDASYPVTKNIKIGNIYLDGNIDSVTTTRSCTGIHAYQVDNFQVQSVHIKDLPGATGEGYGIISWYSNRVWITDCDVRNTDRQNYVIWETQYAFIKSCIGSSSRFRDCILVSTNTPASYQSSYCEIIGGNYFNDTPTGTHVIRFSGAGSGILSGATVEGSDTIDCVYITDTLYKSVKIVNNTIKNGLYGVQVESNTDKYVLIDGNEILSGQNGVRINASGGVAVVINNKIKDQAVVPLYVAFATNKIVSNNTIDGGNTNNFVRSDMGGSTVVDGNMILNNTSSSYALLIGGDSGTDPYIANNTLLGNTVNEIRIVTPGRAIGNTKINSTTVTMDYLNGRKVIYASAAPTSGTWATGDIVYNTSPTAGGNVGWVCITGGSSGTWKTFGAISS